MIEGCGSCRRKIEETLDVEVRELLVKRRSGDN